MNAFFSEHRLLHVRGPEMPREMPEHEPEQVPERVPHAPIAATEARFRMIAEQTMGQADGIADADQREAMRQQAAAIQRTTGDELLRVAQQAQNDVMNEAA